MISGHAHQAGNRNAADLLDTVVREKAFQRRDRARADHRKDRWQLFGKPIVVLQLLEQKNQGIYGLHGSQLRQRSPSTKRSPDLRAFPTQVVQIKVRRHSDQVWNVLFSQSELPVVGPLLFRGSLVDPTVGQELGNGVGVAVTHGLPLERVLDY